MREVDLPSLGSYELSLRIGVTSLNRMIPSNLSDSGTSGSKEYAMVLFAGSLRSTYTIS
ncbi:MAG: hypothetical protein KAT49_00215 [Methanomicrobia archaeon]|nr:hypothetical protein [Methanomicrobia archaeon]